MSSPAPRLVVLSPHLDDAVLSCGEWLAWHPGAWVVTLFAGTPAEPTLQTDWDRRCGWPDAASAMAGRRDEDRRSMALLDAEPVWLPFTDGQYGGPPEARSPHVLAEALRPLLRRAAPACVLAPMGLFHGDHLLVHDAARLAGAGLPASLLFYEDVPYRAMTGLVQGRLAEWLAQDELAMPVGLVPSGQAGASGADATRARKAAALARYRSQLAALPASAAHDATQPERLWRLRQAVSTP